MKITEFLIINQRRIMVFILLIISAVLSYGVIAGNQFTYDDYYSIVENPYLQKLSFIKYIFGKKFFTVSEESTYRPIVTGLNFLQVYFFGTNPIGFHLTNLILHALCAILVFLFISSLFGEKIGFFTALLHAVHPVLSEAVVSAAFVEDLLCLFFMLLAFLLFSGFLTSEKRNIKYITFFSALIAYLLALGSKEMALMFPLLYVLCMSFRFKPQRFYFALFHIVMITFIFCLARFMYLKNPGADADGLAPVSQWFTLIYYLPKYFYFYFFPVDLTILHEVKRIPPAHLWKIAVYWIFFLSVIIAGYELWKRKNPIGYGLLWFIASLVPVSGIMTLKFPFAERFYYLPAVGLHLLSAYLIIKLLSIKKPVIYRIVVVSCAILFVFLTSRSVVRAREWKNDWVLWTSTVKSSPNSPISHYMMGKLYQDRKQLKKAEKSFLKAIDLNQTYLSPYIDLATVYMDMNQLDKALAINKRALKINPNIAIAYMNNAIIYKKMKLPDKEQQNYIYATQSDTSFTPAYEYLSQWYLEQNKIDAAADTWKNGLAHSPYWVDAYSNLYKYYTDKKDFDKARYVLQRGLFYNPDNKKLRLLELKSHSLSK